MNNSEFYREKFGVMIKAKFARTGQDLAIIGKHTHKTNDILWAKFALLNGEVCENLIRADAVIAPEARNVKEAEFLKGLKFFKKGKVQAIARDDEEEKKSEERKNRLKALLGGRNANVGNVKVGQVASSEPARRDGQGAGVPVGPEGSVGQGQTSGGGGGAAERGRGDLPDGPVKEGIQESVDSAGVGRDGDSSQERVPAPAGGQAESSDSNAEENK